MSDFPSQQQDKFVLRLPDGMRDRIKAAADSNNRSMNAEIVATLEAEYPEVDPFQELDQYVKKMVEAMNAMPEGPEKAAFSAHLSESFNSASERLGKLEHEIRSKLK